MRDVTHLHPPSPRKSTPSYDFEVPRPLMTAQAGVHLVVHIVFSTKNHEPILARSTDGSLAAALRAAAREMACFVVAAGNTAEEVHVVVRHPPTVCVSELTHRLKSATSESWSRTRSRGRKPSLEWHPGYIARSCDGEKLEGITRMVGELRPEPPEELEEIEEEDETTGIHSRAVSAIRAVG